MAEETLTLDAITVEADADFQDNGDGGSDYGVDRPVPRPPQTFTQQLMEDRAATAAKYSGAGGAVRAIVDAANKGTHYFVIGEHHNDMATTLRR